MTCAAICAAAGLVVLASCSTRSKDGAQLQPDGKPGTCPPSEDALALYRRCKSAKDEPSCLEEQGKWSKVMFGISEPLRDTCVCRVPDEGCTCDAAGDCLEECQVSGDWKECPQEDGKCGYSGNGCRCRYQDGKVQGVCVN